MTPSDFADFDDDDVLDDIEHQEPQPWEVFLNVRGLLCSRYGKERGEDIYGLLFSAAQHASDNTPAETQPGILFTEDGGEFVGFEAEDMREEF